jgi:Ran GTPase-activating protein 1
MFSIAGQTLKLNSAQDVHEITSKIKDIQDLEEIKLSGNTLGVEAARSIAEALENKNLKVNTCN